MFCFNCLFLVIEFFFPILLIKCVCAVVVVLNVTCMSFPEWSKIEYISSSISISSLFVQHKVCVTS